MKVAERVDVSSAPVSGKSPGERNGNPLQYSCLENSVDRSLAGYGPWGHKELDTTKQLARHYESRYEFLSQEGKFVTV